MSTTTDHATKETPTTTAPTDLPAITGELNHVELVYAPGERGLAHRLFELLGCTVIETGRQFLLAKLTSDGNGLDNIFYASEVTEEQWGLEGALRAGLAEGGALADAARPFRQRMLQEPQTSSHFGIRIDEAEAYEARLAAIERAATEDPHLAGRVRLCNVFRPGDEGSLTDIMIQAFVHTDVVASGLLAFGQFVEIQHHLGSLS